MNVDYIIVGLGLAGLSFAEQLQKHGKSYIIFENHSQQSSRVAGGLFNPVILKRFTLAWNASEMMDVAISFYQNLEDILGISVITNMPIRRRFHSIEEQNLWFEACEQPVLKKYLCSELKKNNNAALEAPFHFGEVRHTGWVNTGHLLTSYLHYEKKWQCIREESFKYDQLTVASGAILYKDIQAKHIVFAEGFGMKKNPFFKELPLLGNKGEYLVIRSPELLLKSVIKSGIFIIPIGNNMYKVGATYNPHDKSPDITGEARDHILFKLKEVVKVPFQVLDQVAGIRPTTPDRKPIVGTHPDYKCMHVFNGLGSRGIIIGPWAAKQLYLHIQQGVSLHEKIDSQRFY